MVCGVFLIIRLPVLAFESGFCRFLGGPGSESNSKRQATSSVVKILAYILWSFLNFCLGYEGKGGILRNAT
jgi:hypothetical protein